jgi:hypothetical protein
MMAESMMKPATQLAAALNEGDWQRDQAPMRASGGGRSSPPPLLGGANPNFVDHFSEERARSHALPPMFAADLSNALGFGHVYAVKRGVERSTGDELAGAIRGW